jgi:hypothetical protein
LFKLLRSYRDGVVHARQINAKRGIGVKVDRQADVYDYLIRKDALDKAFDLLVSVRKELDACVVLVAVGKVLKIVEPADPGKAQYEATTDGFGIRQKVICACASRGGRALGCAAVRSWSVNAVSARYASLGVTRAQVSRQHSQSGTFLCSSASIRLDSLQNRSRLVRARARVQA